MEENPYKAPVEGTPGRTETPRWVIDALIFLGIVATAMVVYMAIMVISLLTHPA